MLLVTLFFTLLKKGGYFLMSLRWQPQGLMEGEAETQAWSPIFRAPSLTQDS